MTNRDVTPQYCYRHPHTETNLRCNRCERPICSRCAIHTETGYRCPDCIRSQQKIFDTARWYDFLSALLASFLLSFLGSMLVSFIGFFSLLLAPVVGMAISEVVRFVIQRRRNRVLFKLVGATVFIGGMVSSIPLFVSFISGITYSVPGGTLLGLSALSLVWPLVYALLSSTTCYYRLAGLQLR